MLSSFEILKYFQVEFQSPKTPFPLFKPLMRSMRGNLRMAI